MLKVSKPNRTCLWELNGAGVYLILNSMLDLFYFLHMYTVVQMNYLRLLTGDMKIRYIALSHIWHQIQWNLNQLYRYLKHDGMDVFYRGTIMLFFSGDSTKCRILRILLYGLYCFENMHITTTILDLTGFVAECQAIVKQIPIINIHVFDIRGGIFTM